MKAFSSNSKDLIGKRGIERMQVVHTVSQLREVLQPARATGKSVGFVPTMGYLHEGHLSLISTARAADDVVVVSVFVNPTQFGANEDLDSYPRDLPRDLEMMDGARADVAFCPSAEALYPDGFTTYVDVQGPMTRTLCGRSRPGHFRGVATIVTKLFHIVAPRRAYFGQKDAQQVAVIQQMARDLDFDVRIVACPTVREADGLAMSSRNTFLTPTQRSQAPLIYQSLRQAARIIETGERNAGTVVDFLKEKLATIDSGAIDYVSVADARTLADLETLTGEVLIAVAIRLGRTRLIDNIRVEV
jgi:pantoate--beta-alanine ligase